MMAGSTVTAAKKATVTAIARAGPTVEKTGNLVKTMATKVTATVAAEAAITFPIELSACLIA
jgi:hypothetical protein